MKLRSLNFASTSRSVNLICNSVRVALLFLYSLRKRRKDSLFFLLLDVVEWTMISLSLSLCAPLLLLPHRR